MQIECSLCIDYDDYDNILENEVVNTYRRVPFKCEKYFTFFPSMFTRSLFFFCVATGIDSSLLSSCFLVS